MHYDLNRPLSNYATKILSMYLDFPKNQPITAVDYRARNGETIKLLTKKHEGNKHLYGATNELYLAESMNDSGDFEKVSHSHYKAESRISKEAFSLAIVDPFINKVVTDEIFSSVDDLVEPDFEAEERERLEKVRQNIDVDQIDLGIENISKEELKKQSEEIERKVEKAVKERKLAFRRVLKEKEKRITFEREDNFLLAKATDQLMPGGILVMITPKEMIDTAITLRLANQYEDIRIIRLEEDEYSYTHKCIILAKKRLNKYGKIDRTKGYQLAETKLTSYREIEEISPQAAASYIVPTQSKDAVEMFRIGPITPQEVLGALNKSNLINNYQESYSQVLTEDNPIAPTALHKGHIMLLLTSGHLNGFIGKGENQHLVKGTAQKRVRETIEEDEDGETTTKVRDFYDITVKDLDYSGNFHKLM